MKGIIRILPSFLIIVLFSSFNIQPQETSSLTVDVSELRNSKGTVQFALYIREDAFPDENYKKCFRKLTGEIENGASTVTFENLPEGRYAVNILHDENNDGKIKIGIILPKEGIGFSNFQYISISNRPSFAKAAFFLNGDKKMMIKIIYL